MTKAGALGVLRCLQWQQLVADVNGQVAAAVQWQRAAAAVVAGVY
jgi:hypothetical protein